MYTDLYVELRRHVRTVSERVSSRLYTIVKVSTNYRKRFTYSVPHFSRLNLTITSQFADYYTSDTMVSFVNPSVTNNKRPHDDEQEHKDIVIENVEFCMLQFYKMNFEAAQLKIANMERQLKKQKREIDHRGAVIRVTQERLHEARLDINHITESNEMLHEQLAQANNERVIMDNARSCAEHCNLKFMDLIEDIMRSHPQALDEYGDRAEAIAQFGLDTRLQAGIPLVHNLFDDEETESESE